MLVDCGCEVGAKGHERPHRNCPRCKGTGQYEVAQQWTVDECPDAQGHWIVRVADGSEHGDTGQEPIATAYRDTHAARIVLACNSHDALLAALEALYAESAAFAEPKIVTRAAWAIAKAHGAKAAIAAAE